MASRGGIEDSQLHALKNSGTGSGVTGSKASFKKTAIGVSIDKTVPGAELRYSQLIAKAIGEHPVTTHTRLLI